MAGGCCDNCSLCSVGGSNKSNKPCAAAAVVVGRRKRRRIEVAAAAKAITTYEMLLPLVAVAAVEEGLRRREGGVARVVAAEKQQEVNRPRADHFDPSTCARRRKKTRTLSFQQEKRRGDDSCRSASSTARAGSRHKKKHPPLITRPQLSMLFQEHTTRSRKRSLGESRKALEYSSAGVVDRLVVPAAASDSTDTAATSVQYTLTSPRLPQQQPQYTAQYVSCTSHGDDYFVLKATTQRRRESSQDDDTVAASGSYWHTRRNDPDVAAAMRLHPIKKATRTNRRSSSRNSSFGRKRRKTVLDTVFRSLQSTSMQTLFLLWASAILFLCPPTTYASVSCNNTEECASLLRPGSECIDNQCTNPFQSGCLRSYLGEEEFPELRICNSEDDINATTCTPSPFGYSEIRILSQNWESAMFTAWILQIVLSELFQVPATIESSGPGRQLNFYDPTMSFSYGALGYDFTALERANAEPVQGGSCPIDWRIPGFNYQSCAHVIPEVWSGHASTVANLTGEGILEPPEGTGVVGKISWFIPKFLARKDPSLGHWLGLTGDGNRRKVAETFRVPTTFGQYCYEIVDDNCTSPSSVFASRPPKDETEAGKYFVAGGVFDGYFRFTPENDCDLNPTTCGGHICDVPCEWTTFVTPQAYHLDVPVQSRGSLQPNAAYSYGDLLDIWAAANATQSAILFYWWYPDPTYQLYLGSEAEMQAVTLPPPVQDCVTNRVTPAQRCSDDLVDRQGTALGSCDAEPHSLLKLVIANLFPYLQGRIDEPSNQSTTTTTTSDAITTELETNRQNPALRSPAYEALQALSITELQLGEIIDAWESKGVDKWNYDPREAVCEWVVDNLETLQTWIPRTYPRKLIEEAYNHNHEVVFGVAVALGVLVSLLVLGTFTMTVFWRDRPLLVFAQVGFLYFLLLGLELVSVGSVMVALEPKDATCVLQNWFILLGYTLELVPLIVKVGAIHRMMQAAKKMKRITLELRQLYGTVLLFCILAAVVLTVWTVIDPSRRNSEITLHPQQQTEQGETVVTITYFCASQDNDAVWRYLSLCWQVVLLLCATVLAYQTRNIRQDLNESHTLGVMIYSHFVFVVLRCITFFLTEGNEEDFGSSGLERSTLEAARSLLLSVDVLVALCIYFAPKMYGLIKHDDDYFKAVMAVQRRTSVHRSSIRQSSFHGSAMNVVGSSNNVMASVAMASQLQSSFSVIGAASGSGSGGKDSSGDVNGSDAGVRQRRRSSRLSFLINPSLTEEDFVVGGGGPTNPSQTHPPAEEASPKQVRKKSSYDDIDVDMKDLNGSVNISNRNLNGSANIGTGEEEPSGIDESTDIVTNEGDSKDITVKNPHLERGIKPALPMASLTSAAESSCISISSDESEREEKKDSSDTDDKKKEPMESAPPAPKLSRGDSLFQETDTAAALRNLQEEAIARVERRRSREEMAERMIMDFIGGSARDVTGTKRGSTITTAPSGESGSIMEDGDAGEKMKISGPVSLDDDFQNLYDDDENLCDTHYFY